MSAQVRLFHSNDAAPTLEVYLRAIRVTAAADYNPEQVAAWAPSDFDPQMWLDLRQARNTVVAEVDGVIAGFTDVSESGYIDMMFVDPEYGRQGVATALFSWVRSQAEVFGLGALTVHASITARPFFELQGFVVDEVCHPVIGGVALTSYAMTCNLDQHPRS